MMDLTQNAFEFAVQNKAFLSVRLSEHLPQSCDTVEGYGRWPEEGEPLAEEAQSAGQWEAALHVPPPGFLRPSQHLHSDAEDHGVPAEVQEGIGPGHGNYNSRGEAGQATDPKAPSGQETMSHTGKYFSDQWGEREVIINCIKAIESWRILSSWTLLITNTWIKVEFQSSQGKLGESNNLRKCLLTF